MQSTRYQRKHLGFGDWAHQQKHGGRSADDGYFWFYTRVVGLEP